MKKILIVVLCVVLAVALIGCGASDKAKRFKQKGEELYQEAQERAEWAEQLEQLH